MHRLVMIGLVLWIVGGCADRPQTIDTSGSHPTIGTAEPLTKEAMEAEVDTGRLVVLSPRIPEQNPIDYSSPPVLQYSGYTVYTEDGHKVAHEDNHGVRMLGPVERKLAPGRYFVRLDQEAPERTFWVSIEKARVTRVQNSRWHESPSTVK